LPDGTQFPIDVNFTDDGLLVQGLEQIDICFELVGLTVLQQLFAPAGRQQHAADPRCLSPADVVSYFEQSAILYIYADDVKADLLGHSKPRQADYQLQQDLKAVNGLKSPTQADIAELLFGDRQKTGGAYRRRILAVMGATTTSSKAGSDGRTMGKAA
jgi:hypothetical protein